MADVNPRYRDMTPEGRQTLRKARSHGYLDAVTASAYQNRLPDQASEGELALYEIGWHAGRAERLNIPVPLHLNVVDPEDYAKSLFCEETGEALQMIGKSGRFGDDTPGRLDGEGRVIPGETPRTELAKEMGDVLAAIEYATRSGLVDRAAVERQKAYKLAKLLSPDSRDNLGRRLAPPPKGWDDGIPFHLSGLMNPARDADFIEIATAANLLERSIVGYTREFGKHRWPAWHLDNATTLVLPLPDAARTLDWLGSRHQQMPRSRIIRFAAGRRGFDMGAEDRDGNIQRWASSEALEICQDDDVAASMAILRTPSIGTTRDIIGDIPRPR